jgi:hypothetical protein
MFQRAQNSHRQDSSQYRYSAKRYMGRHTRRLIQITTADITTVESGSISKRPASLAWLICVPSPAGLKGRFHVFLNRKPPEKVRS